MFKDRSDVTICWGVGETLHLMQHVSGSEIEGILGHQCCDKLERSMCLQFRGSVSFNAFIGVVHRAHPLHAALSAVVGTLEA